MSDSTILIAIVEEVAELVRQGKTPQLQDYVQRFPDLATELERILPLVGLAEKLGNATTGDLLEAGCGGLDLELPQRLGDYELIRQIGMGGMGAVFEARQISLNRLVALKVLTHKFQNRGRFLERFEREARSAAKLHHTNIVPVFGYGEEAGTTFYTMQLIRGASLDQILCRMRRLPPSMELNCLSPSTVASCASTAAVDFDRGRSVGIDDPMDLTRIPHDMIVGLTSAARRFELIAELGIAAAQALHYAHTQGVIHRDIKPANILIDEESRLWITDFGLAKAAQDENLTEQNDLLGTLRYLSPERFQGIADARSDLYSLSLTLFELLTLRPAFDASDRSQLLQQTASGKRPRLKQLNPQVPEPLSIIIEKSLAVEPAERYATVADFADDLQRFLDDKSILAKPDSWSIKFQRWCRHNPLVASLTTALCAMVLGLLVLQQLVMNQRDRYRQSLSESLVSQARFQRLTGQVGQRVAGLQNLSQAAKLRSLSDTENRLLVTEALRSMLLPDLERQARWPVGHQSFSVDSVAISPDFKYYVALGDGQAEVRTVPLSSDVKTELVQVLEIAAGRPVMVKFSPGSRWLIVLLESDSGQRRLQLFGLFKQPAESRAAVLEVDQVANLAADIDGTDSLLTVAVEQEDSWQLRCYDLLTQRVKTTIPLPDKPFIVRYAMQDSRVAVTLPQSHRVQIVDTATGQLDLEKNLGEDIYAVAWHPNAKELAIGLGFDVAVLDLERPGEFKHVFKGHTWMVHQLYYDLEGNYLVSHSLREGNSRVWDLRRRRQILEAKGHIRGVNLSAPNHQELAIVDATHLSTYVLRSDDVFQVLAANDGSSAYCWRTISHPTFPLLISGGSDGLIIWQADTGRLLSRRSGINVYTLCIDDSTGNVITAGPDGFHVWPVHWEASTQRCIIDTPHPLQILEDSHPGPIAGYGFYISTNSGARLASLATQPQWATSLVGSRERVGNLNLLRNVPYASISPDGHWIAGSRFEQSGFTVWRSADNSPGRSMQTQGINAQLFFSPNNQLLLNCSNDRFTMLDVNTWQPLWELETKQVVEGVAAFSPDSRWVALYFGRGEVRIVDALKSSEVLRLDCLQDQVNILNLHFLPDGAKLCLSCGPQGLRIWHLDRAGQWMEESGIRWPLSTQARARNGRASSGRDRVLVQRKM